MRRSLLRNSRQGYGRLNTLVTGCGGFIGSDVSRLLVGSGHCVTGVDSVHPDASPLVRWRLRDLTGESGFTYRRVDITDHESVRGAFQDRGPSNSISAVIHLAAKAGVRSSVDDPRMCYQTNVLGTLNLLELSREFGISRFILASTSSVYGDQGEGSVSEASHSNRPLSPLRSIEKRRGVAAVFLLLPARPRRCRAAVFHRLWTRRPPGHERVQIHTRRRRGGAAHRVRGRHPAPGLHVCGRHRPRNGCGSRSPGAPGN